MSEYIFTSESVGIGHPDKVCDAISDSILDACLSHDLESRVAVETMVTTQWVAVAGEITTRAQLDYEGIVRNTIKEIGYIDDSIGFDFVNADVLIKIHPQSPDISQGVNGAGLFSGQGAGDQGIMFGYATNETENYMPTPIDLAHRIVKKAKEVRELGDIDYIYPDCKSQVTVLYDGDKPKSIETVVFSTHHKTNIPYRKIREDVVERILKPECGHLIGIDTKILVNPTGKFEIGGPHGDTGVTGRKIIVDTYGGYARHGGGAFSGKDPSKVDRSAAYAARWVAKNVVAAGLSRECDVQLSYAIGFSQPLNITIDTFGTGKISDKEIERAVRKVFDLSPFGIINSLDLKNPIYRVTSFGGHFGREPDGRYFSWERVNKQEEIIKAI